MTGDEFQIAMAALDLEDVHKCARVFERDKRLVYTWRAEGPPPHVELAIEEMLAGRLKERGVKWFLRRAGKARDDGDRYTSKRISSSEGESAESMSAYESSGGPSS
jgi:hypothetical protein